MMRAGIVGCGFIARKFAAAVEKMEGVEVACAYSSREAAAKALAEEYPIGKICLNLEEFWAEDMDFVYIATPNLTHVDLITQAIQAGKPVLCEKPMTVTGDDAEMLYALAKEKKVFLMEGMWTRTLPIYKEIRQMLQDKKIGEVKLVKGDYFYKAEQPPEGKKEFRLMAGGGALLDIGIYEMAMTCDLLGFEPEAINGLWYKDSAGADLTTSINMRYPGGVMASLTCSMLFPAPQKLIVFGTKGRIEIPNFNRADTATVWVYGDQVSDTTPGVKSSVPAGGTEEVLSYPHPINGFEFQIREVMDALEKGELEAATVSWEDSIRLHQLIDRVRECCEQM